MIGIYRIHRGPGLQPSAEDAGRMARIFPAGRALLLLVKPIAPNESVAAFFRCSNGTILDPGTSSHEFPFRAPIAAVAKPSAAAKPGKPSRWLIPSAIAAGLGAAVLLHCTAPQSDENPVSVYPINSSSDTARTKPGDGPAPSSTAGKLWPSRSGKPEPRNR